MKFVALVSGGKDSFYAVLEAIRQGHELVCCAHLAPLRPDASAGGEEEEESYMYQTAASECIPTLVEECLGVPLYVRECQGRSKDISLVYDHGSAGNGRTTRTNDEVEDLLRLLETVREAHPDVSSVTSGAILSTYQRTRIESVCSRLSLTSLSYLWRAGKQRSLLECMLEDGIDAVLVKVASPPGLVPHRHLNKTLADLFYSGHFDRLKDRFDFHICGEGGEYETLVLDAPIFKKRLVLDEVCVVDTIDGVGVLRVEKCHAEEKEGDGTSDEWSKKAPLHVRIREKDGKPTNILNGDNVISSGNPTMVQPTRIRSLPSVRVLPGGLAHVSGILSGYTSSPTDDEEKEIDMGVQEALEVLSILRQTLSRLPYPGGATPQDVVFVHLYLSNIAHFTKINSHYCAFFGTILPPSRSCVSVGKGRLPGGRRVMMDCLVQRGSGRYMRSAAEGVDDDFVVAARENPHHPLRSTLHVQSISHWAPICVGPYSQANTVRGGLTFLAGQIGLDPPTMQLVAGGWEAQLLQSWTNAASVLDALGGSLADCLSGLVYVASDVVMSNGLEDDSVWERAERLSRRALSENGGVAAGYVDEVRGKASEEYGGYEDEGTWREMMGHTEGETDAASPHPPEKLPLLMVALPQMPVGAIAEVELVCASSRASSSLCCKYISGEVVQCEEAPSYDRAELWDAGYDGTTEEPSGSGVGHKSDAAIVTSLGSVGNGCAAAACSVACLSKQIKGEVFVDTADILCEMVGSALDVIAERANLDAFHVLHARLYHIADEGDAHGTQLRCDLNSALARTSASTGRNAIPAATVIPVAAMKMAPAEGKPILALQLLAVDAPHLETEMWIHHNRSYE